MATAPDLMHAAAEPELVGLPDHRRELFALRLDRWWDDLAAGLRAVYPDTFDELAERLVRASARAYADRDTDLLRLDQQRTLEPDWFQSPRMLGYATYADRFAGDLSGVRDRVPYLRELGVNYLHLMPLLLPRDGDNDGGYAVVDYRTVRPDLGTMSDLRSLAESLRSQGISLVLDLVLNHVAREHEWAAAARAGDARKRAYFHVYPDRTVPDAYEATLPEVFPDFAPGNFTWDEALQGWVWTTFNSWQWDLDWTNPDVFASYAGIVFFLANAGVEVLRLDAIAFLWKRLGTDSQNQPEVHAITQALHALTRIACPAMLFKAEAIVAPARLVHYLGQGQHHGKVSELAYHNSLMVQIWSMLASRDVTLAVHALRGMPVAPSNTAWITYIRCHDDIGWAISDEDASAVGLIGWNHRSFLSDWYAGLFAGSTSRGLVFQHNPATGDRRISGTAAALAGLDAAWGDPSAPDPAAVDLAIRRLLLAHAVVLGFGGVPVLWMGDELGLPNDDSWASEPGHEPDNRWVHRPRMPWPLADLRSQPTSVPGRMFAGVQHLAAVRAGLEHLHASVPSEALPASDPGMLAVLRLHPLGPMLGLYNVTESRRPWPFERIAGLGLAASADALTGLATEAGEDGNIWLAPYEARWIVSR
jgi:amylosucrase